MPLPRHSAYKESKGDSPMKRITVLILIISLLLGLFSGAVGARETSGVLSLQQDAHRVELTNRSQKLVLADTGSGYQLSTFVLVGNTWEPMFDAGTPLIQGSAFDQYPTEYRVLSDSADKIQVELTGHHPTEGYDFTMTIEATADSPLFHFTIVNHLEAPLGVSGRQPTVMLWMDEPTGETVSVYQESPNYHSLGDSVYWNSCFPAAYVWADGKESAVFFNMEPMDWFSFQNGVNRFKSVQVRCSQRDGLWGIGMDLRKEMGSSTTIAAGDMVVDFYLYGAARRQAPSKLDALGVVVDEFGRCVPSEPVKEAVNFVDPENTSYQSLAENIAQQLMIENVTYRMMPFHTNKTDLTPGVWTDAPLFPEDTITEVVHRPDYATYGAYTPDRDRTEDDIYGDWNCCNNALIPWIAYERLNPDETQHTFIDTAVESLKVYYDSDAKLIRSYECSDDYRNTFVEFMFQNPLMSIGTLKASQLRAAEDFDAALSGKYLMGLEGLIEVAHNCNYQFPQLFSARDKTPATSLDEPALGSPYDVWAAGLYAYDMCMAYTYTGRERYLEEAKNAIDALFEGMELVIDNSVFHTVIDDPYDFPVNEVSNSAYGAAAAQWLYQLTGETKYMEYGEDMRNITLRLVNWYESALRDDPKDQALNSASLSHAFATADSPCPWENIYTYLPLLMELKNEDMETSELLLKLLNLFRNNNKYFYGPMWDPDVFESAADYQAHQAGYLPSEDFYKAENGTLNGLNGPSVYMSNNVFYAYLMFEAFATASDSDILAVNLDYNDQTQEMIEGIERNFIVYNPTDESKTFTLSFQHLAESPYALTVKVGQDEERTSKTAAQLESGISMTLAPGAYGRVSLQATDEVLLRQFYETQAAQATLSMTYQRLQETARDNGVTDPLLDRKAEYQQAVSLYQDTSYAQAAEAAADVLSQLPSGQGSTQDLLADGTDWTAKSGENVALQSYVSSDSGTGSLVTDGSTDTVWVSNDEAGDHYVSIDLGSIQTIGKYTVTGLSGTAATRSFQLESSDDGVAWVLRDLVEDNEEATVTRAVAPFSARYVRVLVRQPAQDDSTVAQLREVELFAADALELEDFYNLSDWSVTGATFTSNGSQAILQKTGDGAAVSRQLRYSVTDYPILQLDVAALSTGATLTVTAERGSDTSLLLTAEEAGRYQVSLADTGWQEETDFTLTLSLSGNDGAQATLSRLECLSHTANLLLNRAYEDAAAATDGLDSTAFTAQGNTTLDVDLGAVETVGRYTVKHGTDSQPSSMTVYASTDGESWTPVDTVTLSEEGTEPTDPPALPPLVFDMTTTDDIIESTSAEVTADSEGTYIRCTGDPFNETIVKKELTLDVDAYPTLEISLADMTPGATVHMQIGIPDVFEDFLTSTGPVSQDGTYRYDLTRYEALTGEVTVYVKFIVYGVDNGMTVTSMRALAPGGESTAALEEEFETVTDWQQTTENAEISTDGTTATIRRTQDEATFGFVAKEVSYNIDEAPLLQVDIAQLTDGARLHVLANDGENEYFVSPSEISNTGTITLNLKDRTGWSGEKTFLLKLMVVGPSGSTAQLDALRATNTPVGSVDDKFEDLSQWNIRENAEITAAPGGGATITGTGSTFGYVARNAEIDLDETPRLMVKVSSLGDASKFHVMLNDGAGDYFLSRTEMLAPGTYNFDLAKVTGWSGKKTVLLKLAVIGGAGASMTVEEIKAMAQPNASDVTARNIEPTEARYLRFEFQSQDTVSVREIEAYSSQDQLQLPTVSTAGELVQFSSHDYHTAVFTRQTAQDLSTWETLHVDVDRLTPGAAWNLSIAPSNSQTECLLFDEPITETGSFSVPIFQRTGWSGLQGYTLKLYVYGGTQQDISLSALTLETGETERPVRPSRPSQPDPEPEETPALPFTDVPENAWYYESVYLAWQEGLIDGMSETSYQPSGSLTVAQTIKLAAALHLKANGESGKLENGTVHWYDPYVDYAVEQGIIEEAYRSRTKAQMDAAVTRSEFVHIFHGALDSYPAINTVAENAIPDVKMDDAYAAEIYDFYRAGILTGSDGEGTFQGTSTIRRSEAAAILIRMYDQTTREHIQLPG